MLQVQVNFHDIHSPKKQGIQPAGGWPVGSREAREAPPSRERGKAAVPPCPLVVMMAELRR